MSKFLNISPEECGRVFPSIEANANRHYKVALLLGKSEQYASAIGHLILGTEEYLKAFAIFLDSRNFGVRNIDGMKGLFTNHVSRHFVIKDFFTFYLAIANLFLEINDKEKTVLTKVSSYLFQIRTFAAFYKWWGNAEQLKQRAFYVDYQDKLISPSILNAENYIEALQHIKLVKSGIRSFIITIKKLDDSELKNLQESLVKIDFNSLVEESVKRKTKF